MIYRTFDEIMDAALINALQRLTITPKTKNKYKYKSNLKSRKGKK